MSDAIPGLGLLRTIDDFDSFREVRAVSPTAVSLQLIDAVRKLDEKEELEPYIRLILHDPNETPHGPAEIADIFTHKLSIQKLTGMAAFILKGRSFKTVRPQHVSHQIYRLEKIAGLAIAIFAAPGTILDSAKENFVSTAVRLGCNYAIFDAVDLARLFVAYGFLCPRDARKIISGRCTCGYSPAKRLLNVFQKDALEALRNAHSKRQAAGLIVLPPGSGKTRIAAEDAHEVNAQHVLYLAQTAEILDVAQSEFEAVFGAADVKRHDSAAGLSIPARVNITTIQLVSRHLADLNLEAYDYIVVDEFHHAPAVSYRKTLSRTRSSFLLGLTATPFRGDRQDMYELCQGNVLASFELRDGIDSGVLSPYHYFGCFDDVDYSKIHRNGVRYNARDLERALIIPKRDRAILRKWEEKAHDKPTVAFCCTHEHARRVAASFRKAGVPSAPYISETTLDNRRALLGQLANGDLKVLCTVDVFNEGADLPFVECLLFLRPTESKRIFYQQLGRGLRQYAGKTHCTVIDFIGNFHNAYRIVEYQSLQPFEESDIVPDLRHAISRKEVLNLPLNCEVQFDEKVIQVFADQAFDPRYATRHNIGRILMYQYDKLRHSLGHDPAKREVDRYSILDSSFYARVFGSWSEFESLVRSDDVAASSSARSVSRSLRKGG
jgi:superfamily II DNA or RNA helicase